MALMELKRLRLLKKKYEEDISKLQDRILLFFDQCEVDRIGNSEIAGTRVVQQRRIVSLEEMRSDYPDLVDEYTYEKTCEWIKVI